MTTTNEDRADWAGLAVGEFAKNTSPSDWAHAVTDGLDASDRDLLEEWLSDLLCDLRHWADRFALGFDTCNDRGLSHYEAEIPGGEDGGPRAAVDGTPPDEDGPSLGEQIHATMVESERLDEAASSATPPATPHYLWFQGCLRYHDFDAAGAAIEAHQSGGAVGDLFASAEDWDIAYEGDDEPEKWDCYQPTPDDLDDIARAVVGNGGRADYVTTLKGERPWVAIDAGSIRGRAWAVVRPNGSEGSAPAAIAIDTSDGVGMVAPTTVHHAEMVAHLLSPPTDEFDALVSLVEREGR